MASDAFACFLSPASSCCTRTKFTQHQLVEARLGYLEFRGSGLSVVSVALNPEPDKVYLPGYLMEVQMLHCRPGCSFCIVTEMETFSRSHHRCSCTQMLIVSSTFRPVKKRAIRKPVLTPMVS